MRTGFFGGTFDPPHEGHLAVAKAAQRAFSLDGVLLAPVGLQPLKHHGASASYADRLRMVELLCEGTPGLRASGVDAPLPGDAPNYTIDTLTRLRTELPDSAFFVIVGADAFSSLRRWHRPDDLLAGAEWIVVRRPGSPEAPANELALSEWQRARVHPLLEVDVPVSATAVREHLRKGESCAGQVPGNVLQYIGERHLYRT